jgi:hypothetical protein
MNVTAIMLLLKRFGPYIAIALVIVGIWFHGRSTGAAKWKAKHAAVVSERDTAASVAEHNAAEVAKLTAAIERTAAAEAARQAYAEERVRVIEKAYRAAVARQARESAEAIEEARRETADLRVMLNEMSVAEACHAAWLEVVQ